MSPILVLPRFEWQSVNRLAQKGHTGAVNAIRHLFEPYKDQVVHCFLCEKQIAYPPHPQPIPDIGDGAKKIAIVALCPGCATMPAMPRLNGCLGMMKKMCFGERHQIQLDLSPEQEHRR
jgi:hypothetical protein